MTTNHKKLLMLGTSLLSIIAAIKRDKKGRMLLKEDDKLKKISKTKGT